MLQFISFSFLIKNLLVLQTGKLDEETYAGALSAGFFFGKFSLKIDVGRGKVESCLKLKCTFFLKIASYTDL